MIPLCFQSITRLLQQWTKTTRRDWKRKVEFQQEEENHRDSLKSYPGFTMPFREAWFRADALCWPFHCVGLSSPGVNIQGKVELSMRYTLDMIFFVNLLPAEIVLMKGKKGIIVSRRDFIPQFFFLSFHKPPLLRRLHGLFFSPRSFNRVSRQEQLRDWKKNLEALLIVKNSINLSNSGVSTSTRVRSCKSESMGSGRKRASIKSSVRRQLFDLSSLIFLFFFTG